MTRKQIFGMTITAMTVLLAGCGKQTTGTSDTGKKDSVSITDNKTNSVQKESTNSNLSAASNSKENTDSGKTSSDIISGASSKKTESTTIDDENLPLYSFAGSVYNNKNGSKEYGCHLINLYKDKSVKIYAGYDSATTGFVHNVYSGTYNLNTSNEDEWKLNLSYTLNGIRQNEQIDVIYENENKVLDYDSTKVESYNCYNYSFRTYLPVTDTISLDDTAIANNPGAYYYRIPSYEPNTESKGVFIGSRLRKMGGYAYAFEMVDDTRFSCDYWWMAFTGNMKGTYSINDSHTSMVLTYDLANKDDGQVIQKDYQSDDLEILDYPNVISVSLAMTMGGSGMAGKPVYCVRIY